MPGFDPKPEMAIYRDAIVVPACHYCYGRHTRHGIPTVHDCMDDWEIREELGLDEHDEIASDLKCGICGDTVTLEDGFWTFREYPTDEDAEAPRTHRGRGPSKRQKQYLRMRDRQKCRICLRDLKTDECTAHHVQPSAKGGLSVPENLVIACEECNQQVGTEVLPIRTLMSSERVRELGVGEMERLFEVTHTPEEAKRVLEDSYRAVAAHLGRCRPT